eukprot:TRINITY_DN58407_c0_g1_i1.p1 TRINITY_DN58407_c0_g1~~TRINITY_DN58407_c0_g1_i1.p1  ORF type:complete len:443 (+),score=58.53 TRINITY_DN58407_c0_g1_i1:78-1406(+)
MPRAPGKKTAGKRGAKRRGVDDDESDDEHAAQACTQAKEETVLVGAGAEACVEVSSPQELVRLDAFLSLRFSATRSRLQRAIRDGGVLVNGLACTKLSRKMAMGDSVVFLRDAVRPPPGNVEPEDIPLRIVYEDEYLLVVNKSAGMCVHPAGGLRSGTLVNALLHHVGASAIELDVEGSGDNEDGGVSDDEDTFGSATPQSGLGLLMGGSGAVVDGGRIVRPGIVHRLDRGTSGLLVVAKDDHVHQHLMRQFAERRTRRRYIALVHGCPDGAEGTVRAAIARDRVDRTRMVALPDECESARPLARGKHAITHWRLLRRLAHTSVIEFQLETGRTHQVRVHAAHLGHPLLGDTTYGGAPLPCAGPRTAERCDRFKALFANVLQRPALHAQALGFEHPQTGKAMDFNCAPHADMLDAWATLARIEEEGNDSGWLVAGYSCEGWT